MTKVAYNDCYGGFGLSDKAMLRYAELKDVIIYPETTFWGMMYWLEPPTGVKQSDDRRKNLHDSDIERDDPVLIKVIEELGNEANGRFAKLRIKNVPARMAYRIDEYDGNESVKTINDYNWKVARD